MTRAITCLTAAITLAFASMLSVPASIGLAGEAPTLPAKPNIVVIMLDDVAAWAAPTLFSKMPTISSMFIRHGLQFPNYYGADPLCCPGRATFLTGLYSYHHNVMENHGEPFQPEMTIATALQDAGYYTFMAGKYLNDTGHIPDLFPPGWDHATISSGGYYDYAYYLDGIKTEHGHKVSDYSTKVITKSALGLMREAPADKPVFAYLTPSATHGGRDPITKRKNGPVPAQRYKRDPRCHDVGQVAPPAYNEADMTDKPTFMQTWDPVRYVKGWPLKKACEALLSADDMVSAVVKELTAEGRIDNTMFLITADNGMSWGLHRWPFKEVPWATQLPLYVSWPAAFGDTPGTIDESVSNIDIAPTLAAAGGATLGPYPSGQAAPDGVSLLSLMLARGGSLGRDVLFEQRNTGFHHQFPGWCAVRTTPESPLGMWHYVRWKDGERELYDLTTDPYEMSNLDGQPGASDMETILDSRIDFVSQGSPTCDLTPPPAP